MRHIPCPHQPLRYAEKNLLYTAVTRTMDKLIMLGTQKALAIGVKNINEQERYTGSSNSRKVLPYEKTYSGRSLSNSFFMLGKPCSRYTVNSMVSTCFSPHGRCEDLIVKEINSAQTNIYIMAYGFTAKEIASLLSMQEKRRPRRSSP